MGRAAASVIAVLLLAGPVAGCGGDDDSTSSQASTELGPPEVRANLTDGGYVVGEDITNGANKCLPPKCKIDADVYMSVDYGPDQERLYASVYFFSDPADAETVATEFSDTLHEVRDTRLYNFADEDQAVFDALVATAEGE